MRLAELGWLHNKIRKYTDQRSLDRSFGLVGQVCASVARRLRKRFISLEPHVKVILRRVLFT